MPQQTGAACSVAFLKLAGRRGWEVAERFVDSDISAYGGKRRPEYLRMLDEIVA